MGETKPYRKATVAPDGRSVIVVYKGREYTIRPSLVHLGKSVPMFRWAARRRYSHNPYCLNTDIWSAVKDAAEARP